MDALVVFHPARVAYLTGFHHLPTERPVALILGPGGYACLVVPRLETDAAAALPGIDLVESYFDYPGEQHPMQAVARALSGIHANPNRLGADMDGYQPHWGYRGPRLSSLVGAAPKDGETLVESLRRVKSANEIACLEVACEWAANAHRRMQDSIRTGRTEMESYEPARVESLRELITALPGWRPRGLDGGLVAMFVAGKRTHLPHGFERGHAVRAGDVLVSGASVEIDGYLSELERTLFVGEPNPAQRRAFEAMVDLQACALAALRPGRPAAEVELEVLRQARDLGVEDQLRHHAGHAIGLEAHESPFLDRGEEAVLEPGMVFTVEPGLYAPELGGFRHSDTVVVTESGRRSLTDYPRDLDSLVVAVS